MCGLCLNVPKFCSKLFNLLRNKRMCYSQMMVVKLVGLKIFELLELEVKLVACSFWIMWDGSILLTLLMIFPAWFGYNLWNLKVMRFKNYSDCEYMLSKSIVENECDKKTKALRRDGDCEYMLSKLCKYLKSNERTRYIWHIVVPLRWA